MLPYRRYTTDSLLPLVEQYLGEDGQSYQRIAAPNGRVRGYDTPDGQQQIDERALHRTTVLRWVLLDRAVALKAEQPRRSAVVINRILRQEFGRTVARSTL